MTAGLGRAKVPHPAMKPALLALILGLPLVAADQPAAKPDAGAEKVTVKAGTFDTFKVVCTTDIGNEETYWTQPDLGVFIKTQLRRTDKSPFGPGTQAAELVSPPALPR